ncbi:uncharacterized protein METZ01_LOCUS349051 [marine metagenome]|uniref:Uncharacterized protein n=1 Tax=marine metagenome TaxID=408172 RepID=A0A382RGB9_9ZZZZ
MVNISEQYFLHIMGKSTIILQKE